MPPRELQPPKKVREWILTHEIESGGIGVVYRARHAVMRGDFAVKAIRPEYLADPQVLERFKREAEIAVAMIHPRIVKTYPPLEDNDGQWYLPMDFMEGQSLSAWLRDTPADFELGLGQVLGLLEDAADALAYVHKLNTTHRDLSPNNLFVLTDGRVNLIDFGFSKTARDDTITIKGNFFGTPGYMSPESLLRGDSPDARSDVYALGIIAFRLLTGRLPIELPPKENFPNSEQWVVAIIAATLRAIEKPLPRVRSLRGDVPLALDELVAQMVEAEPDKRPADAGVVLARVKAIREAWQRTEKAAQQLAHLRRFAADVIRIQQEVERKEPAKAAPPSPGPMSPPHGAPPKSPAFPPPQGASGSKIKTPPETTAATPPPPGATKGGYGGAIGERPPGMGSDPAAEARPRRGGGAVGGGAVVDLGGGALAPPKQRPAPPHAPGRRGAGGMSGAGGGTVLPGPADEFSPLRIELPQDRSSPWIWVGVGVVVAVVVGMTGWMGWSRLLAGTMVPQEEVDEVADTPTIPAEPAGTVRRFVDMDFVFIPPGEFLMGTPGDDIEWERDEKPPFRVEHRRGYWLSRAEVTQARWQAEMGSNPSYFSGCGADCPVENVSWYDAAEFCNRLSIREGLELCFRGTGAAISFKGDLNCKGYRLPTEAEWEYAARANTTTARYGEADTIAWHSGNAGGTPHAVMTQQPNEWKLNDMLGNVWEWTLDPFEAYPKEMGQENLVVIPMQGDRVRRGGSWRHSSRFSRAAARSVATPDNTNHNTGFRVFRPHF